MKNINKMDFNAIVGGNREEGCCPARHPEVEGPAAPITILPVFEPEAPVVLDEQEEVVV